jgi:hypothetical protein
LLTSIDFKRLGIVLGSVVLTVLLAGVVRMADWFWGRVMIAGRELVQDRFDPDAVHVVVWPWTSKRMQAISEQQYNSWTVYDASSPTPFVGAGPRLANEAWSFAIDLQRKSENPIKVVREPGVFTPLDLYDYLGKYLKKIRDQPRAQSYVLPDLETSDHWFVSGMTRLDGLPVLDYIERGLPTPSDMEQIANVPVGLIRHFKCFRVESWERELVVTAFLHVATQGSTLYVEFTPCILPPIQPEYHVVDAYPIPAARVWIGAATAALGGAVNGMIAAPRRLVRGRRVPQIQPDGWESWGLQRDRGARTSVRLLGAIREPKHFFQLLDGRKYVRVLEVQVLNAIVEFLDCLEIDTSDLRARQTMILNSVIMSNSSAHDVTVAAGPGASASVDKQGAAPTSSTPPTTSPQGGSP